MVTPDADGKIAHPPWRDGSPNGFSDVGRCELRLEDGTTTRGTYEFEEEIYDPQSGDEYLVFIFKPDEGQPSAVADDAVKWRSFEPSHEKSSGGIYVQLHREDVKWSILRSPPITKVTLIMHDHFPEKVTADPVKFAEALVKAISTLSTSDMIELGTFGIAIERIDRNF
jgi:hypothetical protein